MAPSKMKLQDLINKEVLIYPGDTCDKQGIIKEIGKNGILFEITKTNSRSGPYRVGEHHFISYSANLSFRTLEK
jgi:hypothetical protein